MSLQWWASVLVVLILVGCPQDSLEGRPCDAQGRCCKGYVCNASNVCERTPGAALPEQCELGGGFATGGGSAAGMPAGGGVAAGGEAGGATNGGGAQGGGRTGGGDAGGNTSGGSSGGAAGGSSGGVVAGGATSGGSSGGIAGGAAGGSSGGVAGGSSGGTSGGAAGGAAGGSTSGGSSGGVTAGGSTSGGTAGGQAGGTGVPLRCDGGVALTGVRSLVAGATHACAIQSDAGVVCWGSNLGFRAGPAATSTLFCAHPVPLPSPALKIAAGTAHTCAIVGPPDRVLCWGELPDSGVAALPLPLPGLGAGTPTLLALGEGHTCVYFTMRAVAIGIECVGSSQLWFQDAGFWPGNFISLCAGRQHTCAVRGSGAVECWGGNGSRQVQPTSGQPVISVPPMVAIGTMAEVYCGANYTCARNFSNDLTCWGSNTSRKIDASSDPTTGPTTGLPGALPVATGWDHMCFGFSNGTSCRGNNTEGQASGTPAMPMPVSPGAPVPNTPFGPIDLAAGAEFSCAQFDGGRVMCWGQNESGQLGRPGSTANPGDVVLGW